MFDNAIAQFKNRYPKHSSADIERLTAGIQSVIEDAESSLKEEKSHYLKLYESDNILEEITELFDGKVGEPYPDEKLDKLYKEAERRYQNKVPPGYGDAKKPVPERYGDFIVWSQIKDYAGAQKKPIIFITDDAKEDWWLKHEGKTRGPRPELIQEMQDGAGVRFYMYASDRFIEYAQKMFGIEGQQAVKEITGVISSLQAHERGHWLTYSERDTLTGLANRRQFEAALRKSIEQWRSYNMPCTLLMIDVDHLKKINDAQGHVMGDEVIRHVASVLESVARREDMAARVGGDELALLITDATDEQGVTTAIRLQELLSNKPAEAVGVVTVSVGVATCPTHADSEELLYAVADAALYQAKSEGRNRIVVGRFGR
jgi:diguanylate cyclase (GGDEF)-like protein